MLSPIELSLEKLGLKNLELVYWNLPSPSLYEEAIRRREGHLAHAGPLAVQMGCFKVQAPQSCPGAPAEILNPAATWPDPAVYETQTRELAVRFHKNFAKFKDSVDPAIRDKGCGPCP